MASRLTKTAAQKRLPLASTLARLTWLFAFVLLGATIAQAQPNSTAPEIRAYSLKNKTVGEVEPALSAMLNNLGLSKGQLAIKSNPNTNQLFITATPQAHQAIAELIRTLDLSQDLSPRGAATAPIDRQPMPPSGFPPQPSAAAAQNGTWQTTPPMAPTGPVSPEHYQPGQPGQTGQPGVAIRQYVCLPDQLARAADYVRTRFNSSNQVRVATDPARSTLFVEAPTEIQSILAGELDVLAVLAPRDPQSQGTLQPQGGYPRQAPAGIPSAPPSQRGMATDQPEPMPSSGWPTESFQHPQSRVEKFIPLPPGKVETVVPRLRELFGNRLFPLAPQNADPMPYGLETASAGRVDIEVDRRRNGILLQGPAPLVGQLESLILYQANPPVSGEATRFVPFRNTDADRVREAIDAYRTQELPAADEGLSPGEGNTPESGAPLSSPPPNPQSFFQQPQNASPQGAINLVNYEVVQSIVQPNQPIILAQAAAPTNAPAGTTAGEMTDDFNQQQRLRDLGKSVQVEILPDLDVIILHGRKHDVEEMSRIIAELERLSEETIPEIEIVALTQVQDSTMMAIIRQVSPELIGGRQGRVSITPLIKPNALLLIGWGEAVRATKELIQALDQPVEPETQFQVFSLKSTPVAQAAGTIRQFFARRGGLGPAVLAIPEVRTNSLIVRAAPRDMAEVKKLLEQIDTDSTEVISLAKVIKLKNSLATELAATLQSAINATAGRGAGKTSVLEMLEVDGKDQKIIRSGILTDVRLIPDVRTNTLLVSASANSMELIEALIKQFDTPAVIAQIKVFQIVNSDANNLVRTLRSLLPSETAGTASRPTLPIAEGETSLAPVRFAVDTRTNSIIATGSKGDLAIIEALLLRLDGSDVVQRQNEVYRLKNAPAVDVARAINDFLRSERQVQQATPGIENPFLQMEREVVVVPEAVSNSLVISATPRFFPEIHDLVEKLDAQPPQVVIQVLIAEVGLDNFDEFGIEVGLQDSLLFDRSLLSNIQKIVKTTENNVQGAVSTTTQEVIVAAENSPGYNFVNTNPLGNSGAESALARSDMVGGQGLTTFSVGRSNQELGYGGLVLSASSESVSLLIRALQECQRLEVLSRPQITTLDNQPAFIQVGERVPRIVGTTINATGQVNNIEMEDVGLILAVTPRISPDGTVVMELDAEKSEVGSVADGIPVSISEGQVVRSPKIKVTSAQTTVSATTGETIVLGGLIVNSKQEVHRRVPFLSDIPILGHLFRYDSRGSRRAELLIIMTPWVVMGPCDMERIKQRESARMNWCLCDINQLQGDTGLYELGEDGCYPEEGGPEVIYPQPLKEGEKILENRPPSNQPNQLGQPNQLKQSDQSEQSDRPEVIPSPPPITTPETNLNHPVKVSRLQPLAPSGGNSATQPANLATRPVQPAAYVPRLTPAQNGSNDPRAVPASAVYPAAQGTNQVAP